MAFVVFVPTSLNESDPLQPEPPLTPFVASALRFRKALPFLAACIPLTSNVQLAVFPDARSQFQPLITSPFDV